MFPEEEGKLFPVKPKSKSCGALSTFKIITLRWVPSIVAMAVRFAVELPTLTSDPTEKEERSC